MTSNTHRYKILAAVQFDETGDGALREATRIARLDRHGELHVLHVVPTSPDATVGKASGAAQLASARAMLRSYVERSCAGSWIKVVCHIRSGDPSELIVSEAAAMEADLIVVGTHRRNRRDRALLGSIAETTMREAHCPVLVAVTPAPELARVRSRPQGALVQDLEACETGPACIELHSFQAPA